MPNARAQPIELQLPVKGIDKSLPFEQQPPLTTPDCLNVRALDLRDRLGIGKRSGFSKAFTTLMTASDDRVVALATINQGLAAPVPSAGAQLALDENFDSFAVASPADIGANFVPADIRSGTSTQTDYTFTGYEIYSFAGADRQLRVTPLFTSGNSRDWAVIAVNFYVLQTDGVTLNLAANGQCSYGGNTTFGPADGGAGCGPFIRGAGDLRSFLIARLRPTAANTVRFEIASVNKTTVSTLVNTSTFVIDATATVTDDLQIRIYEDATTGDIKATILWPSQPTCPTGASATISVTTSFNSGEKRGGAAIVGETIFTDSSPGRRNISRIRCTKLVPPAYTVYQILDGNDSGSGANFFLNEGWTGIYRSNNVTPVQTQSPVPADSSSDPTWPAVDNTANQIKGTAPTIVASSPPTIQFVAPTTAATELRGIDFKVTNGTASHYGCLVTRISSDFTKYLAMNVNSGSTGATTGVFRYSTTGGATGTAYLVNGTTTTTILNLGTDPGIGTIVCYKTDRIRWTDDGSTIRAYVNGMLLYSFTPAGVSLLTGNTNVGIALANTDPAGVAPTVQDARIVLGESTTPTDSQQSKSVISAYLYDKVYVGDLRDQTLSACSGGGLLNPLPSVFSFARKFYAVDGSRSIIVDPTLLTSTSWVATAGTLPAGCRIGCLYRGRGVLARQDASDSAWFMSRVFDLLDWDYGSAVSPSTVAVAGTNADVGQPGDTITALIPFSDDYLIFGCSSSIWMLEGDPGYGGALQPVSYQTGVLGPRAWCFDEHGNLYFMGSNGLYRMLRGSRDPELVSGRRLATLLDRVNTSTTLVQCVYDSFKGEVQIFLTPATGASAGTHVIYSVREDAFWPDQYPTRFGPFSAAQITGSADEDRRFIIGGDDGYIRRPKDTVYSDDGDAPSCRLRFAPLSLAGGEIESLLTEFRAVGQTSSGAVTYYWLSADSAADMALVQVGSASASGALFGGAAGYQAPVRLRIRGGAHALVLAQNSASLTFALEKVSAMLAPAGRRR